MKRYLLLLVGLLFAAIAAKAQPFFSYGTTGSGTKLIEQKPMNSSATGQRAQYLYPPAGGAYYAATPAGYITQVGFYAIGNATNATYTSFTIRMKEVPTSQTALTSSFEGGPWTDCLIEPSYVIPTVLSGGYVMIPLTTPFPYDPTKGFIIEVTHAGFMNGFPIYKDGGTGNQRSTYANTQGASSGTTDNYLPFFQFEVKEGCDSIRNLQLDNVTDSSADFSWTYYAPQDSAYEYIVNTDPAPPTLPPGGGNYQPLLPSSVTNLHIGMLEPDSCYYLHIAKKCISSGVKDTSLLWQTRKFCTLTACHTPKATITNVLAHTGFVSWDPVPGAYEYEWAVSISPTPPTVGTRTTYTKVFLQGLTNSTYYFFHLRAYCSPTPKSAWGTTPLQTMVSSVDDVTGDDFDVAVYPNPVKDMATLRLDGLRSGAANAEIVDVTGKVLRSISISKDETSLDMSGLAPGMYIIKYKDDARNRVIKINKQ